MAEQAHEWLLRLETAGPEECEEFWRWLMQSPVHVREILRAEAAEVLMRRLFATKRFDADAIMRKATAANIHPIYDATDEAMERARTATVTPIRAPAEPAPAQSEAPARKSSWRYVAMAASAVVLVAAGALSYQLLSAQKIRTGPSEWKTVTLSDGSEVTAGPRTQVEVSYTNDKRTLRVITGEAMFHVQHSQLRPFYVETELATARAVGTSFAVTETADQTTVTVEDGVVAVTSSRHQPLRLLAGDQVSVTKSGAVASLHVDPAVVLAWTHQAVIFNDRTIEEAVQEFNKRSRKQIHVLDSNLKHRKVSGMFSAADPDSFARALKAKEDISIKEDSDTLLLVPNPEGADKGLRKPQER